MADVVVGVDVGGSAVRAVAVDAELNTAGGMVYIDQTDRSRESVLENIVQAVAQAGAGHVVKGVGVAVPAFLRHERGTIEMAPNLPELTGWEVQKALEARIDVPIVLENDANAGAFGEMSSGVWEGCDPFIYFSLGTGVGGGIIVDGEVMRGATGLAAELGHITIYPDGALCGCGDRGCLEAYASATGIVRMFLEATSELSDSEFKAKYGPRASITGSKLADLAADGDLHAFESFAQAGRALGIAVTQMCRIFDPAAVCLGGRVSRAWSLFWPAMWEEMVARIPVRLRENLMVQPATLAATAGAVGVAGLAWRKVLAA
ncbi:MAG: ROK family protein [Nitrospirota bacterium]|nr:ROK family protein [Nitrospirota bacterium]